MARAHVVKVRMSAEELDQLDVIRNATGLSRADQVRFSALGSSDAVAYRAELTRILGELGKIGSNINQMAQAANASAQPEVGANFEELEALIRRVRSSLRRKMAGK